MNICLCILHIKFMIVCSEFVMIFYEIVRYIYFPCYMNVNKTV